MQPLALELGATVHGAVTDVLVHADGYKKSIPGPGIPPARSSTPCFTTSRT